MSTTGDTGTSAGGRHGSKESDTAGKPVSGLQESSGEFRVGEKIVFGMSNGNIRLRRSPQGDEVEVSESTLASAMIDLFFTDKFEGAYETVSKTS
jgi:hypothetical protein